MGTDTLEGEGLAERMLRFLPEPHKDRIFPKLPFIYTATDTLPQPGLLRRTAPEPDRVGLSPRPA